MQIDSSSMRLYLLYSTNIESSIEENAKIYIDVPGEDNAISFKVTYIGLQKTVCHEAGPYAQFSNDYHIGLLILGPTALFNKNRLISSRGKEKQKNHVAHIACLT